MEIIKEKLIKIISGAAAIAAIGTYLFLYRPLISRLKIQRLECKSIESEVNQAREAIAALNKKDKKTILNETGVSAAIDELTREAKSKGVNLISITPGQAKEKEAAYKILPIEMEIESAYEGLGVFLGSLDKLEKSLVTIDSFSVISEKESPLNIKTKLVINMYLAGGEYAE